jgi:signal peptidase II
MDTKPSSSRLALSAYLLAIVAIILDQIVKYWVLNGFALQEGQSQQILPFFHLTLKRNFGVSFGLFDSPTGQEVVRWLLTAFSAIVAVALGFWVRQATRWLPALAIGLIIGGAVGNLIDRIRWRGVTDFLDFGPIFPWIFNVADSCITVGVVLLLLDTFLSDTKPKAAPL